jgi:S1-C subfamily serine protease
MIRRFGLLILVLTGTIGGLLMAQAQIPLPVIEQSGGVPSLAPVLAKVSPSVVAVLAGNESADGAKAADKTRRTPKARAQAGEMSAGSGVIFDADRGLIVTNNHVVEHSHDIGVTLVHGRRLPATLVGADPDSDLAVLKVPPEDLTGLPFGNSDELRIGDFAVVVGVPFPIGRTMTSGIVSGLHRSNVGMAKVEDFIQTDAAIYPGDSGGALVNLRGELIGINAGFVGQSATHSGLGLAIPSNLARRVVDEILAHGEVRRGTLGVTVADPKPMAARDKTVPRPVVEKIDSGSSAERAGLKKGDIIMAVDGSPVREVKTIQRRLGLDFLGDTVALSVMRDGQPLVVHAVLEEAGRARSK